MSEPETFPVESNPPTRSPQRPARPPIAFSNGIRLTGREWIGLGLFSLALLLFAPPLWEQIESFPSPGLEPDYRMPYALSNDYWHYDRWTRLAAAHFETLVIGDSVVWGPYVARHETLSHYLNEQAGRERCANLGLNGAHPAALAGLLEYHAGGMTGKKVLLQCNPLWLTSPVQDLQEESQAPFNHPELVAQFFPLIPRYQAEVSQRIGIVVDRQVPFTGWTKHLQETYFDQMNLPHWTLEHPCDNPAERLRRNLPPADEQAREKPVPWFTRGRKLESVPWVDVEKSLQWYEFQRAVRLLQQRDNQVFVLLGPYNEHMLTVASRQRYREVQATMTRWLQEQQVMYLAPAVLPSPEYGDASHPLASGYRRLARQLGEQAFFKIPDRQ
jgi:hypothetical protein